MMKLLANENFPLCSVKFLKSEGFDVKWIGFDFQGIEDVEVVDLANLHGRIIITFDRDYGTLIFKKKIYPIEGVIYLRLDSYDPEFPGRIVKHILEIKDIHFRRTLTVFYGEVLRQKKY